MEQEELEETALSVDMQINNSVQLASSFDRIRVETF
jgi:hypothetical protein